MARTPWLAETTESITDGRRSVAAFCSVSLSAAERVELVIIVETTDITAVFLAWPDRLVVSAATIAVVTSVIRVAELSGCVKDACTWLTS